MTAWMLWAVAITALLGAAAHLFESVLRARERQGRWPWVMAMAGATAVQAWALLVRREQPLSMPGEARSGVPLEEAGLGWWNGMSVAIPPVLEPLDIYVGALWLAASVVLLVGLVGGFWRLSRRAHSWPHHHVAGHEVLMSDNFGPALLGILSPRIVLPRWLVEQGDEAVALVCLHEAEHRQARDTWLLAGAAFTVAVLPWNAALWWQLMRLRAAIELDCDKRVVDDGAVPSRYAGLLLSLGVGGEQLSVAIPAFIQPRTLLERRLTVLINGVRPKGPIVSLASVVGTALLTAVACAAPAPALGPEASPAVATSGSLPSGEGMMQTVRGLADATMIFVDGERIDDGDRDTVLGAIDPDDVESIEVIKGFAATARYGADASGGVIEIILKNN